MSRRSIASLAKRRLRAAFSCPASRRKTALSDEVARAAKIVDEQAVHLSQQVAHFVVQLRESGATAVAPAPRADDAGKATSRALRTVRA